MTDHCSDLSRAAGEDPAGSGIEATRWLIVESRQQWEADAVASGFPPEVSEWLGGLDAKVLAMRRPGRVGAPIVVFAAETTEAGGALRRLSLRDVGELREHDPWSEGDEIEDTLLMVCTHGRRDACCSRLGIPVFHALDSVAGPDLVWQCSHTGGHRFAANVVALPWGVTLGRVTASDVPETVVALREGRIPLAGYRGRSLYPPAAQAADVAIRRARSLDRLDALRLAGGADGHWTFETEDGVSVEARVTEHDGPVLPKSCGAEPEPVTTYRVELVGAP